MSTATAPPGRIEVTLDERDQKRGLGDFLLHVAQASEPGPHSRDAEDYLRKSYRSTRAELTRTERRALGVSSGVVGGYAVPSGMVSRFVEIAGETAIVRPRATVLPMEALELQVPMLDQVTAQAAGSPPYFGGFLPSWGLADGASVPGSEPKFRTATLAAQTLSGHFECSRTLLSNSPALSGGLLERICGDATAWMEDVAFLTGDGIGKPLGIAKSQALVTTAARSAAGTITHGDTRLLSKALLPSSRARAVYLVSQAAEDELLDAAGSANSVFGRVTTHLDPATGRERAFLNRCECLVSEKLPALNTVGDFGLYAFDHYLIGDLLTMEVMASGLGSTFRTGLVGFRLLHHVAGLPMLSAPVTLHDGTSQASPFVALGAGS